MASVPEQWPQANPARLFALRLAASHAPALRKAAPYLFTAVIAGLFFFPFVRVLTRTPDEGTYLYGSLLASRGAIPGRDFIELSGPGAFYWLALWFRLFGATLFTARVLLWVTAVALALLAVHLSRRAGASGIFSALFILVTSIPLMVMNSPHYDTDVLALLSLVCLLHAESAKRSRAACALLACASLCTGLASCILQQKGLYLFAALVVATALLWPRDRLRRCALAAAAYALPLAVELAFYLKSGALRDLIYTNITLPLTGYSAINAAPYGYPLFQAAIPSLFHALRASCPALIAAFLAAAVELPFALILLAPATLLVGLYFGKPAFARHLLPFWLFGYALFFSEFHRHDIGHLRNGCLLIVILLFILCETQRSRFAMYASVVVSALLVVNACVECAGALSAKTVLHTRRGAILAAAPDPTLDFLLAHTQPGEPVYVYPYRPIYYFIADVENPTRCPVLMYEPATLPLFEEAVRRLEAKRVRYIVWDTTFSGDNFRTVFPAYRQPPPDRQIIEPYLESHYHPVAFFNGIRILERNR